MRSPVVATMATSSALAKAGSASFSWIMPNSGVEQEPAAPLCVRRKLTVRPQTGQAVRQEMMCG